MGNSIHNPDQAAYNILLNSEPYKSITKFSMSESSWAAQLGTTILEAQPIWKDNYVCTSSGIKHTVVHQYDRIPLWRGAIEKRYS